MQSLHIKQVLPCVFLLKSKRDTDIANVIGVGSGNHIGLYKEFIQLYPEFANKLLEKLAKIETTYKDM